VILTDWTGLLQYAAHSLLRHYPMGKNPSDVLNPSAPDQIYRFGAPFYGTELHRRCHEAPRGKGVDRRDAIGGLRVFLPNHVYLAVSRRG